MKTEAIQIIELLSLKQLSARCQMEIAITYTDGTVNYDAIDIDHYTYNQLSTLLIGPQSRIRLSLYPKWDPYQKGYYSTIIRTTGTFSEKLYYGCTEAFVQQLKQLKQRPQDAPAVVEENVQPAHIDTEEAAKTASAAKKPALERKPARAIYFASRWKQHIPLRKVATLSAVLILLMLCRVDVLLFIDRADAVGQRAADFDQASIESMSIAVAMGNQSRSAEEKQLLPSNPRPDKQDVTSRQEEPVKTQERPHTNAVTVTVEPPVKDDTEGGFELFNASSDKYTYKLPKGYVALTFDDGPSVYTKQIVDALDEHGLAGTFFFVGKNAAKFEEEVKYAADHGMSVGNHSWDHSQLTELSGDAGIDNILKTNQELLRDGAKQVTLFRPPYGSLNDELEEQVGKQNMKVIMWNRDPEDWDADTRDEVIDYFKQIEPSGGIFVLHEKKHTVEALPAIIQYLQEQDLKFVIFQ
ncbi:polysaccharide deacetylase family protein [Paenibacillus xylaniclasticus]|uniref:polysaccharide deacetylase family protein n=1 Tax=Paenibacillus xylaniclasticus TaxID=588083 RepID=UPI000FD8111E|nr:MULTISPECIES: polysaccharide deacetylase family protein [Paenibacillus]GFN32865.1 hypothetical protein PCURB6_31250 [Paenibacillus curdlanolyticus]